MATAEGSQSMEALAPLLESDEALALHDYVDYKGRPSKRSKSGGWRSAGYILGAGSLERFAFRGMECNLINYLTGPLGETMAVAAANVNIWTGIGSVMPLVGGFLADSVLGLHRTNIITCIIYILGLALSTISVVFISNHQATTKDAAVPATLQVLFFFSLYLVALAQGFQSSIQVFGADQFDRKHPEENKANCSFFNWWLFGLAMGVVLAIMIIPYIQENIGWGVGFGITCLAMIVGLILLLVGNTTYRFAVAAGDEESSRDLISSSNQESLRTKSLSKEVFQSAQESISCNKKKNISEAKKALKLFPIWCTTVAYTIAWAQAPTIFTKQASTVDRSIGQTFTIPSASVRIFIPFTSMCSTPIYDLVFVPIARKVTGNPTGITEFQRIKIGMTISIIDMVIAAIVEMKRREIARDHGLVDIPNTTLPLSFWWLVPQNVLSSIACVFTQLGMQKFFYDGVPSELRSIGLSLSFGALGAGNLVSSFLIYAIDKATSLNGRESWFCDNLNRAHLDYFYWVLAGLGFLGLIGFVFFAKSFSQEKDIQENPQA